MQRHGRHQLCHHIGFGIAEIQSPAHIPDGTPGSHGAKSGNLCHMISTVLFHNIFNDFSPALLTEIRIKVGHTDTLWIQKALKDQRVFHGIYFRNMHTIGNDGSRTRASAGANRNSGFFGIADKIPDDEIVIHISHPTDDTDLIFQPFLILRRCIRITFPEAIRAELAEICFVGIALRHRKSGQMVFIKYKFQITPLGNPAGVFKGFIHAGEKLPQFILAL